MTSIGMVNLKKVILPPALVERACLSWSSGIPYALIAKWCGVHHRTIRKIIKESGTKLKPKVCENALCRKVFQPRNVGIFHGGVQSFCSNRCKDAHKIQLGRKYGRELRLEVIKKLGGECVVCGITDYRVLQVNHINGGGRQDFLKNGPSKIYRDILSGARASEFDLRCANCNRRYEYEQGRAWSNEKIGAVA
jgi:hypothetical protein